ncbi:Nonribosomal peptide synthetase 12 [Apiospora rasikravindrae]|uniref:Nonribosomal peptide synthetase 12 n=1 Tax=Apiospora rasikravindrae TaxID=990691 RepID=A0ABR1S088_9PEZI
MATVQRHTLGEISKACGVPVDAIEDVYPCTPLQVGIMAQPDQRTYSHTLVFTLSPSVDKDRFCEAVCHVVAKNSVLRTRIVNCDLGLSQAVIAEHFQVDQSFQSFAAFLEDHKSTHMYLGERLLRICMVEDKFILTAHHAICDNATLHTLVNDTSHVYHGEPTEPHADYKLFSEHCASLDQNAAKAFWESKFSGQPSVYPPARVGHIPEAAHQISKEIKIRNALYKVDSTLIPSYIQAAWGLTTASYLRADSIAYGFVCSGRTAALGGLESTLGPTIASVPMQMNIDPSSTIAETIKECTRDRRETQASPALQLGLINIRQVSEAAAAAARFATLLSIVQHDSVAYTRDMTYEYEHENRSPYCLGLVCTLSPGVVSAKATFDEVVIPQQQMSRVLNQFEHILQTLIRSPKETTISKLQLVGVQDRREVLEWNRTVPDVPQQCLHDLLKMQACDRPDQLAVSAHDGDLTFEQLHQLSDRLAYELRSRGVSTEAPVALLFEKSLWAVVAQVGVLKAGGVCVPIDPSFPMAQKLAIISSSKSKLLVTSAHQFPEPKQLKALAIETVVACEKSLSGMPDTKFQPLDRPALLSQAAYILFTSGSTGAPKGVILEHRNLVSALTAFGQRLDWTPGTRVLQFASSVWGASIIETLGTLIFGGCVCIPSDESRSSDLANYVASAGVDCAILTPTVIQVFSPSDMPSLKTLCSAGEPVDVESARRWSREGVRFFNGWGQSETSVCSTLAELSPDTPYPRSIGTPVGCAIWIADETDVRKLAPIGAIGHLIIEGPGVTRGYLSDEARTAEAFIPSQPWTPRRQTGPIAPQDRRLYSSGDLARYYADGSIEYIGRQSSQVKIHGQRFDLGEVEKAICSCPAARGAFAMVQASDETHVLVAVLTLSDPRVPAGIELEELPIVDGTTAGQDLRQIRDDLVNQLPSYMVPTAWLVVQEMPRTASAKLDRQHLKEWVGKKDLSAARMAISSSRRKRLTAPASDKEKVLYSAWATVLSVPDGELGRESSLLRLGGDSVTAMQISSLCRKSGVKISVATLLRSGTLSDAATAGEWLSGFNDAGANTSTPTDESDKSAEQVEPSLALTETQLLQSESPRVQTLSKHLASMGISPSEVQAVLPCTSMQDGILFAQMRGAGEEYWNTLRIKLSTDDNRDGVDPHQLAKAWQAICDAQPILRTFFISSISESECAFQQVILKDVSPSISQGPVKSRLRPGADFPKPEFSPTQSPHHLHLTRVSRYVVYATIYINHALMDERSMAALGQMLRQAYTDPSALAPGPDLGDYVAWDRRHRTSARDYWSSYLSGVNPCLVPLAASSVSSKPDVTGCFHDAIPKRDASKLHEFCRDQSITLANLVQVAWGIVLRYCTGMESVCFGSILSQQSSVERGDETLGPLLAMVVCNFDIHSGTVVRNLLERSRDDALAVLENGGCPLSEMHDHLGMGDSPLFNTAMTIARTRPGDAEDESGMRLEYLNVEENPTEYPLTIAVGYDQDTYGARIWCDETKISGSYASEVGTMFSVALNSIMQNPGQSVQDLAASLGRGPASVSTPKVLEPSDHDNGSTTCNSQDLRIDTPSVSSAEVEESLSDTEAELRQLWSQILIMPAGSIERNGNFFELGGNSIRAMRLVNKAREAQFSFTVADVFKNPVLCDLAAVIMRSSSSSAVPVVQDLVTTGSSSSAAAATTAPLDLRRVTELSEKHPCFRSDNIESVSPVTEAQAFTLGVSELDGESLRNTAVLELLGGLDMARLAKACEKVVQHHALLRTVFIQEGSQLYQVVLRSLPVRTVTIQGNDDNATRMGFDEARYLPRFQLISKSPDNSTCDELQLNIHHVLYDAISLGLVLQDLRAAYIGEPLSDTPKFSDWVLQVGCTPAKPSSSSSSYDYWRQLLSRSSMTTLTPPTLPVRGASRTSSTAFRTQSRNLKTRHGLPSSTLNAAWATALFLATGSRDLVFGAANANRSKSFPNVMQVPGPCLNLLPCPG